MTNKPLPHTGAFLFKGTEMKICNKCGVRKVTTEFYNHPNTIDGLQQPCKSCKVQIHTQLRKDQLSVSQTHLTDKLQKKQALINESIELLKKREAELQNYREKLDKKEKETTYLYQTLKEKGEWVHKLEDEVKLIREQLNVELDERRTVLNQLHFIQAEVPRDEAYSYRHEQLMETLTVANTLMNRILDATMTEAVKPKKQNIWQKFINLITQEDK